MIEITSHDAHHIRISQKEQKDSALISGAWQNGQCNDRMETLFDQFKLFPGNHSHFQSFGKLTTFQRLIYKNMYIVKVKSVYSCVLNTGGVLKFRGVTFFEEVLINGGMESYL